MPKFVGNYYLNEEELAERKRKGKKVKRFKERQRKYTTNENYT